MTNQWLMFAAAALLITGAGVAVSYLANALAVVSKWGGLTIGLILLALITSLPELSTAVSAGLLRAPNLSAGDLFGSGLFNLAVLAVVDLINYRKKMLKSVALGHVVSGGFAIIITAAASLLILLRSGVLFGGLSWGGWLLALVYIDGLWLVNRHEKNAEKIGNEKELVAEKMSVLLSGWGRSALAAALVSAAGVIFAAAPLMAATAKQISAQTGIETTFLGTLLIAAATSLPELVVSITAARLGAFDMVVGNIFGSNAFNMVILVVLDVFYLKGSVFKVLTPVNAVTGLFVILITTLAVMGLVFHSEKRYFLVEPDAVLILILCLAAEFVVWSI